MGTPLQSTTRRWLALAFATVVGCGGAGERAAAPAGCGAVTAAAVAGAYHPAAIAVARDGSFYVAGSFEGTVDFDAQGDRRTAAGYEDAFVTRFAAGGAALWTRTVGGTHTDVASAVVLTSDGGVAVAGWFGGDVDLDPGPGEAPVSKVGNRSAPFVLRLSAAGAHVASRGLPSPVEPDTAYARSIALDGRGGLLIAGTFLGHIPLGDGRDIGSGDGYDGFAIALGADLRTTWATVLAGRGTPGDDGALIAVGPAGQIWAAGASHRDEGTVARSDGFVARLGASGAVETWVSLAGAPRVDPRAVVATSDGGAAIAGALDGDATVEGASVHGDRDGFVARVAPDGTVTWARAFGTPDADDALQAIRELTGGALLVAGQSAGAGPFLERVDAAGQPGCVLRAAPGDATATALDLAGPAHALWTATAPAQGLMLSARW